MISQGCDVALRLIEACSPGISESCLHKIIEKAIHTQGISVYGVTSEPFKIEEYELHKVTSKEIGAAEDYANPNTKVQGASFVHSGPIHQRVASL
ncbi:MAG: hypothetical protein PG981_001185 [Wolbachia endosymbiont of Ctenocephalides orientis wCori]|nr:MAG: hypothetical protein PG981_001185 [Wolbachia endosymbiont of Ctenocephalides orientis wCori]